MKLNLELDIDWIDEDQSIDDEVKQAIINGVTKSINRDVRHTVKKAALRRMYENVDTWINEKLEEFCDRRIQITDKWGDPQEHHESVTEMFKVKFDSFFNASVDKDGKELKSCSYGQRTTRIDHMLNKKADEYLAKIFKEMDRSISSVVNRKLKEKTEEEIRERVIEQVTKVIESK